ncbi:hypothetical protein CM15mP94_2030 [bacterium]|nr:MAG: hypothetical protein CM15mP94_2030 [bacterium]
MDWSFLDFFIMSSLIFACLFSMRISYNKINQYKKLILWMIFIFFIMLWAEMAVGIFNSPIAGD